MAHKDLSDRWRIEVQECAFDMAAELNDFGQSLALAREAWINAFDRAAEELDAQGVRAQADREYYDQH